MKRWLIVVSLLVVCRVDVAVAASQSPSLLDRILAVFHLRTTHPAAPASTQQAAQKAEPAPAKPEPKTAPAETAEAVREAPAAEPVHPARTEAHLEATPLPASAEGASKPAKTSQTKPAQTKTASTAKKTDAEKADPIRPSAQPAKTVSAVETPHPAPAAALEKPVASPQPASPWPVAPPSATKVVEKTPHTAAPRTEFEPKPDAAAPPVRKAAAAKAAVVAARATSSAPPIETARAAETTQSVYSVASIDTRLVAAPPALKPMPAPVIQSADTAQPLAVTRPEPAKLDQGTQVNRQGKSDKAQPVHVAILGAPNLKAALPQETPIEAPRDEPRAPSVKEESKSACNNGQRIVSAYYWEGHHTASGQPFNPRAMTAAHRTLPFGTHLNVTNPRTGKSVEVVVNDRGPYVRGVGLDLSLGAAQAIGLRGTGSVCVL